MCTITIKIPGIAGESLIDQHTDELEAATIADVVAGGVGASRTYFSEVALTRYRDRGSPLLAHACATGAVFPTAEIYLFHNTDKGTVPFMSYELSNAIVSRYEMATADSTGRALQPHQGFNEESGAPSWRAAFLETAHAAVNDYRDHSIARATPQPIYRIPRGASLDKEIERLWLSADLIRWTIVDGAVERGWDLQAGMEAA